MYIQTVSSPIGNILLTATESGLTQLVFSSEDIRGNKNEITNKAAEQLAAYFQHELNQFSIPLAPLGTTFQKTVWNQLQLVPYGKTATYQEIAIQLGNVKSIRAAASANGKNPIPIIIPCHRIIGSDGSLTGYSGGLDKKRFLLELEGSLQPNLFS